MVLIKKILKLNEMAEPYLKLRTQNPATLKNKLKLNKGTGS